MDGNGLVYEVEVIKLVGEEVGDTVSEVCLQNLELALDSSMPTS